MDITRAQIKKYTEERTGIPKVLLLIFFAVGVAGTAVDLTRDIFISLTPFALLLCFAAILSYHRSDNTAKDALVFGAILLAGFFVEAAGVNTGMIFGNYEYGDGLGLKIFSTPLLIGLNWAILTYCTAIVTDKLLVHWSLRIPAASALMVLYDLIMEQVAPAMRMWSFKDGIPAQNYIMWFVFALIFHTVIKIAGLRFSNTIAPFIFIIQGAFFLILYLIFRFIQ
ncbi:MAG TPA: carotenoid biosynthesis protein [Bacteroidales bacterium]|nr:carotenoid biosynthesis protein [Bacteroidales bacterium]